VGEVVRLHDGLRVLYPDAIVFGAIGTSEVLRELDRLRALLGLSAMTGDRSVLSIAVSAEGLTIWAEAPVLTLRLAQLAVIAVDEGTMDVTALVAGRTTTFSVPLAVPAESPHIADRVLAALTGARATA
jgi:hypothetical protein